MEQTVEPADFGVVVLRFQFFDVTGRALAVGGAQQRNRLAHGFGFEEDPQLVGFGGIALDQWRYHCAFVGGDAQQFLRFELAQGFAHRHAADAEQIGQILLAQGGAAGQAPIEDGRAQGFFDDRAGQVRGNRPIDFDALQRFGLLCHDYAPCLST